MGAWGYAPMENDEALEWLLNEVEAPLLATIKKALQGFLEQTDKDDVKTIEAEAAAALLADLTRDHATMKYSRFRNGLLGNVANHSDLWSLAAVVITKILEDKDWLSGWTKPQLKTQVLEDLLSDLQSIQERSTSV